MATFGNITAGGDTFPCSNDRAMVSKFTLTEAGDVTDVTVRFDASTTAGSNMKGLIYDDDGTAGAPGTRLAVGAATAIPAGGGLVASALTVSLAAGDYWLGFVADSFQATLEIETTGESKRKEAHTYASPSDPWGTDAGTSTEVCAYATYTASVEAGGGDIRTVPNRFRSTRPAAFKPGIARRIIEKIFGLNQENFA